MNRIFTISLAAILICAGNTVHAQARQFEAFKLPADSSLARQLYLQSFARRYAAKGNAMSSFPRKTGVQQYYNVYQLPADNMPCLVPNNKIIGHIQVYAEGQQPFLPPALSSDDQRFQQSYRQMDKFALITP
ncbi:MAG: hypothetical protein EOO06_04890 [Chitinophagaceae bacterium]|nr:MAG: hypothetical protein EOO06_04890 [Chitinophagaceae bacterium]